MVSMFRFNLIPLVSLVLLFLAPNAMAYNLINGALFCNESCVIGHPKYSSPMAGADVSVSCVDTGGSTHQEIAKSDTLGFFQVKWQDESTFDVLHCVVYISNIPSNCNLPKNSDGAANGYLINKGAHQYDYRTDPLWYYPAPGTKCPVT